MVRSFTTSDEDLSRLLEISRELFDIKSATELLHWDQETYMPPKGILHRGRQLATLSALYHEKLTRTGVGELVKRLGDKLESVPEKFNDSDRALVRETKRAYEKAVNVPVNLVRELSEAASVGLESWKLARKNQDFALFKDSLTKMITLKLEYAHCVGFPNTPYDALLDDHEPDLTTDQVKNLFNPLRTGIKTLLNKIQNSPKQGSKQILRGQKYSKTRMVKITEKILEKMGYDFEAGRQDLSAHPFTINFGHQDVRVTNRFLPNNLASSIFSAIHEGGHALYELGIDGTLGGTILASGTSLGIHESQSRLWENMVGRSLEFWKYWLPYLKRELPSQIGRATAEEIFQEVNEARPGSIRVDADEVTYNLHILIRFEIEKDLFGGKLKISDLPQVWNDKYQELLGITPPNDAAGILQDIHWSQGSLGYFPTYTMGNLYAAQFFHKLSADMPEIKNHIESGNFYPLLDWLRERIHRYGSIYKASDLVRQATGEDLNPKYFIEYLTMKFSHLYEI